MHDVTEEFVNDVRFASHSKLAARVTAAKSLTAARAIVLAKLDGRELGFVSNALIYDQGMRDLKPSEHKTAIALLLGGFLRVFRVSGPLPGKHAASRPGANAEAHYVLRATK